MAAREEIIVVGLGITGLSVVRYLLARGHQPVVMDSRAEPPGKSQLPDGAIWCDGGLDGERLAQARMIVLSPGMPLATPEISQAAAAGVEIVGDVELFAREARAPIVAITGSNGKTTVTTLVGEIARQAGWQVAVGGNIGTPALELLDDSVQLYVLELSSFQLETTCSLRPAAATVLNVTEDHMDRYASLEEYRSAKAKIYQGADCAVINRDDPLTHTRAAARVVSFGRDNRGYGLAFQQGECWLTAEGERLVGASELPLSGQHNLLNMLAALALVEAVGIPRKAALATLKGFRGLPHRCERLPDKLGCCWINDSKATNVGATLAAIEGLRESVAGRLYVILGGDGKDADFSPLAPALSRYVATTLCFGRDGGKLAALSDNSHLVASLDEAVAWLAGQVCPGDWVLLSPACASLDMYRNYMERGDHFRRLVEAL